MGRRVAITSVGIISNLGFDLDTVERNILKNNINFKPCDFNHNIFTIPIKNFNLKSIIGRYKNARYLNRGAQLSVAAAFKMIKKSKISLSQFKNAGLFVGAGPNLDFDCELTDISQNQISYQKLNALWILKFLPNTATSIISNLFGIHGENFTVNTACASSLQAIGEGFLKIRDGHLELAVVGGGDSRLSRGAIQAYNKAGVLFQGSEPQKNYRPLITSSTGFIPGEGGAFLLLEELSHAKKRNATIFGEILGYGSSFDGSNLTSPNPKGLIAKLAIEKAFTQSCLSPKDIDLIVAHGTGTPLNDSMENNLLKKVYKQNIPEVLTIKPWTGHLASACGVSELAITLGQINRRPKMQTALIQNFGFGGQNAAIIFKSSIN